MVRLDFSWLEFDKEFAVEGGDFSQLEIRASEKNPNFHFFYDRSKRRLITDFVLQESERVATLCNVTLIRKDDTYTPRLKFWKKDRTQPKQAFLTEVPDTPDTRVVKSSVDTSDCYRSFWKLISFLQEFRGIALPAGQLKIVGSDSAEIASLLQASDKGQLIDALQSVLGGRLTQAELDIIANRKGQLEVFRRYLTNPAYFEERRQQLKHDTKDSGPEAVWQDFFEHNPWIFGYGLSLVACQTFDNARLQQITTGASAFGGAGKRIDSLLRTRGIVSSLLFCEIKRHDTRLLATTQYRKPDVYAPSSEVVGAVAQVQKTAEKAVREIKTFIYRHDEPDGTPTDIEVSTVKPRQIVVVGQTSEFEPSGRLNHEMVASFELYRRSVVDVEIMTFDELYERARFIVQDKS